MEIKSEKPAYLMVCVNVREPEKMGPYTEAAVPLFAAAGIEQIALGAAGLSVDVFEGEWPYKGALMLFKGKSMAALSTFMNSPEYKEAVKLREGIAESHFVISIEATS
jgi:uncharacterized protein (DUF1330 family)